MTDFLVNAILWLVVYEFVKYVKHIVSSFRLSTVGNIIDPFRKMTLDDISWLLAAVAVLSALFISWHRFEAMQLTFASIGVVFYIIAFFIAIAVVGRSVLFFSRKPFTKSESISLIFVGLIIGGLAKLYPPETLIAEIKLLASGWQLDFAQCTVAIIIYTALFFLSTILAVRALKDIVRRTKILVSKLRRNLPDIPNIPTSALSILIKRPGILHPLLERAYSRKVVRITIKILYVVVAFVEYTFRLPLCTLIALLQPCIKAINKLTSKLNSYLTEFINCSDRAIAGYAFRISAIVTVLLVVIGSNYHEGLTDAGKASLEVVGTVIVIPLAFEWIQAVKQTKSNCKNKTCRQKPAKLSLKKISTHGEP